MAVFKDTEQMYEVLGGLFTSLMENEAVLIKFLDAKITILYEINDPKGQIWLAPSHGVVCGPCDATPDVTMWISGDDCHRFWLKELKLPVAIAMRKIKTKGSLPKVLKMLPLLGPAYEAYPDIARKHGLPIK
jgi:hypothetical protein